MTVGAMVTAAAWAAAAAAGAAAPVRVERDLAYARRPDGPLKLDLYVPPGEGPFPGLLVIHGGAWAFGDKFQMSDHARAAARAGYAAASISYRLAPRHKFPAQLEDCWAAWKWLAEQGPRYGVDPRRMAVYGYSAGGHLACLMGLAGPEAVGGSSSAPVRAVAAGGAVADFRWVPPDSRALSYFLGGSPQEAPAAYRRAAPLSYVSADDPPVFLFHGQRDRLVPLATAQRLVAALRSEGVRAELYVVEGKGHVAAFFDAAARRRALAFLDDVLRREPQAE